MKIGWLVVAFAVVASASVPYGVAQSGGGDRVLATSPVKLDRLDAAVDRVVPMDAVMEEVVEGFTWTEGPVWVEGRLLFADITSNSMRQWQPQKGASIFLQPSGWKELRAYKGPEPGSNGMTLDVRGRVTVAGHAQRDVYRLEKLDPAGPFTILADTYEGKRLNSPNDLVYKSDGTLYFTDPPYGLESHSDADPEKQLVVNGVYRIKGALTHAAGAPPEHEKLELLIKDLPRPNGIAFSPDEKFLYVDNSQPQKTWMRYTVQADGTLAQPRLLYDATADPRPGNPDGMKVDVEGNIYSAGPGGVWIFTPEGKPLGTLVMPNRTSNVAWAGADRKTLYITCSDKVFRVRLKIAGAPMTMQR
jgi:gluconolactonase